MINSKIETILCVITLYGILVGLRFLLPVSDPITNEDRVAVIISSLLIWYILIHIYIRVRNKKVIKKVDLYIKQNEFDICVSYIEKCLKGHKKNSWLKIMKAYVLAMAGRIGDYYDFIKEIENDGRVLKNPHFQFILKFDIIFSYIMGRNLAKFSHVDISGDTYMEKIYNFFQNISQKNDDTIPTALQLYRTSYSLYKSVIALVLAEQYEKNGDMANVQTYVADAKKYAPSAEVLYYLTKHEVVSSVE